MNKWTRNIIWYERNELNGKEKLEMKEKKWQKNDTISIIYLIFMKKIRI